jgi:hypothetical protein
VRRPTLYEAVSAFAAGFAIGAAAELLRALMDAIRERADVELLALAGAIAVDLAGEDLERAEVIALNATEEAEFQRRVARAACDQAQLYFEHMRDANRRALDAETELASVRGELPPRPIGPAGDPDAIQEAAS